MYSTVPKAVQFKTKLLFNPYDPIIKKEQSVLTKLLELLLEL